MARAAASRQRGDRITPLGDFQIGWINHKSRYHLFFGLNYPNLDHAAQALKTQRISKEEYQAIKTALLSRQSPPQNTKLGGYIGIHGLGRSSLEIHHKLNWTDGCIALTNEQIRQLARWVKVGTTVIIS